jgi:hypothetical protein
VIRVEIQKQIPIIHFSCGREHHASGMNRAREKREGSFVISRGGATSSPTLVEGNPGTFEGGVADWGLRSVSRGRMSRQTFIL